MAAHGCSTLLTAGQTISSVWFAPTPTPNVYMSIPASLSPNQLSEFSIQANTSALCDAVPVLWQNTDVQILALLSSASTTESSKTSSVTATNTGSSSSTPISLTRGGLSSGAKAAIGVVIPLVLIALVIGIFLFMRRRKQASILREAAAGNAHELGDSGLGNGERFEMGGAMAKDDKRAAVEADAGHVIQEMSTGTDKFGGDHYGPGKDRRQEEVVHEMPADDWVRRTDEGIEDGRGSGMSRDQLLPRKPVGGASREGSVIMGEPSPSLGGVSEATLLGSRNGGT